MNAGQKSDEELTAYLAERAMGWKVTPDRFIKSGRSWIPRWRFQPLNDIADALDLLNRAANWFTLVSSLKKVVTAEVNVAGHRGKASGKQIARTITIAVARALGLDV